MSKYKIYLIKGKQYTVKVLNKKEKEYMKILSSQYAAQMEKYNYLIDDPALYYVTKELIALDGDIKTEFGGTYSEVYNRVRKECVPFTKREIEKYFKSGYGVKAVYKRKKGYAEFCGVYSTSVIRLLGNEQYVKNTLQYYNINSEHYGLSGIKTGLSKDEFDDLEPTSSTKESLCAISVLEPKIKNQYEVYLLFCSDVEKNKNIILHSYWKNIISFLLFHKPYISKFKTYLKNKDYIKGSIFLTINNFYRYYDRRYSLFEDIIRLERDLIKNGDTAKQWLEKQMYIFNAESLFPVVKNGDHVWGADEKFKFDYTL